MERHPDAQLIFHQDSDTLVDWRQALPRFLRRIFPDLPPEAQDLRSLGRVKVSFCLKHVGLGHLQCGFENRLYPEIHWLIIMPDYPY